MIYSKLNAHQRACAEEPNSSFVHNLQPISTSQTLMSPEIVQKKSSEHVLAEVR